MCQLSFINSNDKELNKSILLNQYLVNTVNTHKDGWGFFHKEFGVFKTHLNPWITSNLADIIEKRIKNDEPILAHVRLATATNKVKEVCTENSHPFETNDFVVAHNGSFEGDILSEKRFKDKIDSEIFTILLQEAYDKNPKMSIIKLLEEAYTKNLTGKFAFLIYFKPKDKFYVVRGRTASLYMSYVSSYNIKTEKEKKIGFIINTEKNDIIRAFQFAEQNNLMKTELSYTITEPELLKLNTVFQVNKTGIREIGTLTQVEKVVTTPVYQNNRLLNGYNHREERNRRYNYSAYSAEDHDEILLNLYDSYGLSPEEIDLLFLEITGMPIVAASKEYFEIFEDMLDAYLVMHTDHKHNLWRKLTEFDYGQKLNCYEKYNLQFPYFVNEVSTLNNRWVLERAKKQEEEAKQTC